MAVARLRDIFIIAIVHGRLADGGDGGGACGISSMPFFDLLFEVNRPLCRQSVLPSVHGIRGKKTGGEGEEREGWETATTRLHAINEKRNKKRKRERQKDIYIYI